MQFFLVQFFLYGYKFYKLCKYLCVQEKQIPVFWFSVLIFRAYLSLEIKS